MITFADKALEGARRRGGNTGGLGYDKRAAEAAAAGTAGVPASPVTAPCDMDPSLQRGNPPKSYYGITVEFPFEAPMVPQDQVRQRELSVWCCVRAAYERLMLVVGARVRRVTFAKDAEVQSIASYFCLPLQCPSSRGPLSSPLATSLDTSTSHYGTVHCALADDAAHHRGLEVEEARVARVSYGYGEVGSVHIGGLGLAGERGKRERGGKRRAIQMDALLVFLSSHRRVEAAFSTPSLVTSVFGNLSEIMWFLNGIFSSMRG